MDRASQTAAQIGLSTDKRYRPQLHRANLSLLYERLYENYGPQYWWPVKFRKGRWEVILGAILTQAAAWSSVERALDNLSRAGVFSPREIRETSDFQLAQLLRPAIYFNTKARKVKAFAEHLKGYGDNLESFLGQDTNRLRLELLSIYGIGEETADDILLYAAHRPMFVIDNYTCRILERLQMGPRGRGPAYARHQTLFHHSLPADSKLFQEYHALLDRHGSEVCRSRPICQSCCLTDLCPTGQKALA